MWRIRSLAGRLSHKGSRPAHAVSPLGQWRADRDAHTREREREARAHARAGTRLTIMGWVIAASLFAVPIAVLYLAFAHGVTIAETVPPVITHTAGCHLAAYDGTEHVKIITAGRIMFVGSPLSVDDCHWAVTVATRDGLTRVIPGPARVIVTGLAIP